MTTQAREPFLLVDKPSGIATHATDASAGNDVRFVEYLSSLLNEKLFVVHRLDKGTSGAQVFARSSEAAARLAPEFESKRVQKSYVFVTDREVPTETEFTVQSEITKRGSEFVSSREGEMNAETEFKLLHSVPPFSLWEARPKTGKPHQIRLHAESSGLAILGDDAHNGSPFARLCLHARELRFEYEGASVVHTSAPPLYFAELELLHDPILCSWLSGFDRRRSWLKSRAAVTSKVLTSWRVLHSEDELLRAEQLGDVTDLQWFSNSEPDTADWQRIRRFLQLIGARAWRLHLRRDRGRTPQGEDVWTSEPAPPARWQVLENDMRFEMRADSGLSSGLFLDQRANRRWVFENSRDRSILNLFSYTSGFSVAAALGGASRVVSVDLSKNFLEWSRQNFALNEIDAAKFEFRPMDSREYLKYAHKKGFEFDIVICDPPSFSRSDKGVFRLEKDLGPLLEQLVQVLPSGGCLVFATNFEGWADQEAFEAALNEQIKLLRVPLQFNSRALKKWPKLPPADLDFELPGEPRLMKAVQLIRN